RLMQTSAKAIVSFWDTCIGSPANSLSSSALPMAIDLSSIAKNQRGKPCRIYTFISWAVVTLGGRRAKPVDSLTDSFLRQDVGFDLVGVGKAVHLVIETSHRQHFTQRFCVEAQFLRRGRVGVDAVSAIVGRRHRQGDYFLCEQVYLPGLHN